jgi:hypothetical protein
VKWESKSVGCFWNQAVPDTEAKKTSCTNLFDSSSVFDQRIFVLDFWRGCPCLDLITISLQLFDFLFQIRLVFLFEISTWRIMQFILTWAATMYRRLSSSLDQIIGW